MSCGVVPSRHIGLTSPIRGLRPRLPSLRSVLPSRQLTPKFNQFSHLIREMRGLVQGESRSQVYLDYAEPPPIFVQASAVELAHIALICTTFQGDVCQPLGAIISFLLDSFSFLLDIFSFLIGYFLLQTL